MKNILVIRLKSIGDILFTLPAVHALRENFPNAKITFLTSGGNAPLLRGFQEVDDVIALDRAALQKPLRAASETFRLLRRLREEDFSLAVDFQGYGETAWLSWWSGAPQRWGSVYGKGRAWAYTHGPRRSGEIHPADWNLSLLKQCGLQIGEVKNDFVLPDDALAAAGKFFSEQKLDAARPALFIQPFTSSPQKNWPLQNYLTLARHWRSLGLQIIFGGGPADWAALGPARAEGFCISAGAPLLVSAGLVTLSSLMLGGDTGLGHIAVAGGKRVVMVMMGNQPGFCVPFRHPEWTVVPAQGAGIATIPVAAVLAATEQAFSESTGNASC